MMGVLCSCNIQQKVNEQLGPLGDLINEIDEVTWDWWRDLEEVAQEYVAGLMGDDARDYFANYELPETFSAEFCEEIVK